MIDKSTIKRILLLRMDRIGDLLWSTPAIRSIRKAYPDARIDLVASKGNHGVVIENPDIDNLYVFNLKQYWLWPWYGLRLRLNRYDMAVALNGRSKTTSRLISFINPRIKVGSYASKTAKYYDITARAKANEHTADEVLNVAIAAGAESRDQTMVFPVKDELIKQTLARFPRQDGVQRVGVFIGNAKKMHGRWPEHKFVELTNRLLQLDGLEIYVMAGPGDEKLLEGFTWSDRCKLYPGGSLQEVGAFLKTCDLMVTSPTGPMHLAVAIDVPTVSPLSQYSYDCWRPLTDIHRMVHSQQIGTDVTPVSVDDLYAETLKSLNRA